MGSQNKNIKMSPLKLVSTKSLFTNKIMVVVLAVICTMLWGSTNATIKLSYTLFNIGPENIPLKMSFAGVRFTLSGVVVLTLYLIINRKNPFTKVLKKDVLYKVVILGLIRTALLYFFYYVGLAYIEGAKAAILNSFSVFFSAIIASVLYKDDKITLTKGVGIVLGLIAVTFVNFDSAMNFSFVFKGDGFIIIATLFSGIGSIFMKEYGQVINILILTGFQLMFGGLLLLITGLVMGSGLPIGDLKGYLILLYMIFLSATALTVWTTLLRYNKVSSIMVYYFLIPIFGTFFAAIILKESVFKIEYVVSLFAAVVGIYIVNR